MLNPQVPSGQKVYEYGTSYIELIDKVADEFDANKDKITIIGFSHGCYGLLGLVSGKQNYFSAAIPIGCSCNYKGTNFTKLAVWCFVGSGDGAQSGSGSMAEFVNDINWRGGNAKFTRVDYRQHTIVNDEYSIFRDSKYNVIDWAISQTRIKS